MEKAQAKLLGDLIGLARATENNEHLITPSTDAVLMEGLALAFGADPEAAAAFCPQVEAEKRKLVPMCFACAAPCGRTASFDLEALRDEPADIQGLKERLLEKVRQLTGEKEASAAYCYKALIVFAMKDWPAEALEELILEAGTAAR